LTEMREDSLTCSDDENLTRSDPQDNILDDFAMEASLGPETLRSYVEKYPTLALELTDLYHELLMVDLSAGLFAGQDVKK